MSVKEGREVEAELAAAQRVVDSFLEGHPEFNSERGELVTYYCLVKGAVREIEGVRQKESKSERGSIAKQKAIEIIRRHSNGLGIQHKEPLVQFMSNIWEIEYDVWGRKNDNKARN